VRLLAVEARRVHAFVRGASGEILPAQAAEAGEGVCTCPDLKETGGCKHIAALAADALDPVAARALTGRFARLAEISSFESDEGPRALLVRFALASGRPRGARGRRLARE
jgi:uncharacterized Zn finger protein